MKKQTLEEWIRYYNQKEAKKRKAQSIKMLNSMKKEILSKTNMFVAEKSVVELVFEKYIKELRGGLHEKNAKQ